MRPFGRSTAAESPRDDAALPLIPEPRSVQYTDSGEADWLTDDPFGDVTVGVNPDLPRTEYSISIHKGGAAITAGSEPALADARNAFAQIVYLARLGSPTEEASAPLAGGTGGSGEDPQRATRVRIPAVVISDRPEYAWRGLMVDVARHFYPVESLRSIIDVMAIYRLNVLHLHLTDDQGWRFEVRGYPRLTDVGAWRERTVEGVPTFTGDDTYVEDKHGGFYSQEELRQLVDYAKARGVQIVPEVSIPGHAQAAIAAYPRLGNYPHKQLLVRETWGESQHILGTSEESFQFVRDVLEQVADIFDSPFVHIGGDEVPVTEWEQSPEARSRRQEWGYTRASEILRRYTDFAAKVLKDKGKRVVARDSAHLVRLPDDTLVIHHGDSTSLASVAARGFQVIAASDSVVALDHVQSGEEPAGAEPPITVKDVYTGDLFPKKSGEDHENLILGVHAHASGEYIPTPEHLQYMLLPRLVAVAQRAWGAADLPFDVFENRLRAHEGIFDLLEVASRRVDAP